MRATDMRTRVLRWTVVAILTVGILIAATW
jgi:hypothetical protein